MSTQEKRRAIEAFVRSMHNTAFHALNAKDGLEMGIPSKPELELCCKEFKKTMWFYNQLMDMDDVPEFPVTPVIECEPPVYEYGVIEP